MTFDRVRDTLFFMTRSPRRVKISFDREREALRGLFDAVTNFRRTERFADAPPAPAPMPPEPPDIPLLDDRTEATRPDPISKAGRYLAALAEAYGPLPASALAIDTPFVDTLVLDASALSALAGGNVRARAHVARAVGSLCRIVVPATSLRSGAHQRIADLLADVVPIDSAQARLAATLLVGAPGADPFDALTVAAGARAERAAIVTTTTASVERLVLAAGRPHLYVFSV